MCKENKDAAKEKYTVVYEYTGTKTVIELIKEMISQQSEPD